MKAIAVAPKSKLPGRKAPIRFDADAMMKQMVLRNQVLFGSVNADRGAFERAIAHLAEFERRWPKSVHGLITGRFALEAAPRLLQGDPGGIKNLIELAR